MAMQDKTSSFWLKVRRLFLCLSLLFMFEQALTPAPAHAFIAITDPTQLIKDVENYIKEKAGWLMETLKLTEQIDSLVELYNKWAKVLNDLLNTFFDETVIKLINERLKTEEEMRMTSAIYENRTKDMLATVEAAHVARMTPPNNTQLCRSIMLHQLVGTTMDFARELSRMIVEGINNRSLYAGSNGPLEEYRDFVARCGGDLKMGGRFDPYCSSDKNMKLVGTDGRTGENLGMHGVDGSQVYEMPMIETKLYTDPQTKKSIELHYPGKPTTDDQMFWLGAFNFYYDAVGHRPIPMGGSRMATGVGLPQRVLFNSCTADQNAFVKQCADLLAFYTRPNSSDPASQKLRERQNALCKAAKSSVDMARFGNCEKGLSVYEAYRIQEAWCLNTNHTMALKAAGATDQSAKDANDVCADESLALSRIEAKLRQNCTTAMAAMSALNGCWADVESFNHPDDGVTPTSFKNSNKDSGAKKVKATPISFDASHPAMAHGR